MAKQTFTINSKINAYVETTINLPNNDVQSDLFSVSISKDTDPKITISIDKEDINKRGPNQSVFFAFYKDNFQQMVDWLRNRGMIK